VREYLIKRFILKQWKGMKLSMDEVESLRKVVQGEGEQWGIRAVDENLTCYETDLPEIWAKEAIQAGLRLDGKWWLETREGRVLPNENINIPQSNLAYAVSRRAELGCEFETQMENRYGYFL